MEGEDLEVEEIGDEMDEDEFYETVTYLLLAGQATFAMLREIMIPQRIKRRINRRPISRKGYQYIHRILNENPENFRQLHRMYPNMFIKLCSIIREGTPLEDTRYICVEEMLATFLIIFGHNDRYCNVRQRFVRSHFATSKNFNKVLKALNTLAPHMMVTPGPAVPSKIRESTRFYPYFKDCIGAIDGTHIPAMIKDKYVSSYRNRHGIQSQNVLAACNFDMEFIYVLSGWEGSAHDSKMLNDALSRRNGLQVPPGKFFLVDCGFANRRQFLAPLRCVRYHLKDFNGEGRHPKDARELFNLRHASLRNVIERTFGVFKSRFTIFKTAPPFPFQTQAELVLACVGLHNFLRKECRSDEFPIDEEDDPPPNLHMEDENLEGLSQSQLQRRSEANHWRFSIAEAIWANRPLNNNNSSQGDMDDDVENDNENPEAQMNNLNLDVNGIDMEEHAFV